MNELDTPESAANFAKDLDIILHRQVNWLSDALARNSSEAEELKKSFHIEQVDDAARFWELPAHVEVNKSETKRKLLFDMPTFEDLIGTFGQTHSLTSLELAELYIGTGIAGYLLKNRVNEVIGKSKRRFNDILTVLTDSTPINEAIIEDNSMLPRDRNVLIQSLSKKHEDNIGQINVLRFAFGMVYLLAVEPESEDRQEQLESSSEYRIGKEVGKSLLRRLAKKPIYLKVGKKFRKSSMQSENVFADSISEFEIAACYPMGWQEIDSLLNISK